MNTVSVYKKNGAKLHKSTNRTIRTSSLESKSTKKSYTTAYYTLAALISCSFDCLFNNKKGGQNEKEDLGESEKQLI